MTVSDELDDVLLARSLLGEIVSVTAEVKGTDGGDADHFVITSIESADVSRVAEFENWVAGSALTGEDLGHSMEELRIPGLDVYRRGEDGQAAVE